MPAAANRLAPAGGLSAISQTHEMRQPLAISAGVHLAILILAIVGLPFLRHPETTPPMPISISMVPISDIARTTHEAKPDDDDDDEDVPSKANEPPTTSAPPPPPPEPVEAPAPKPLPPAPAPPPKPVEAPAIEPLKPVQQMQQQVLPPLQVMPPLQKPLQIVKPKPVVNPSQEKPTKQQDQDFNSLLKNLSKDQQKADEITHDRPVVSHPHSGSEGMMSNTMTASERNAIAERLKACWVFPAGAYDAEDLIVDINAEFNEDKTLKSARVVDTARYSSDAAFRAAADAALRALRNPMCNPLPLPDGKYADWGTINMTFDPKIMMAP